MRLCILEPDVNETDNLYKDFYPIADVKTYFNEHCVEVHFLNKKNAVKKISHLSRAGFDIFINLCDGSFTDDYPGIEVVTALERYHTAFTGPKSNFYDPTRQTMKTVCYYNGINTPNYCFVNSISQVEEVVSCLKFPMIVKHHQSYNSIGLTQYSKVENVNQLSFQLQLMIDEHVCALVEEFIDGREFSVLVAENAEHPSNPIVYQPVEFVFPEGETFKHFEMKWKDFKDMQMIPCADAILSEKLMDMAKRFFVGINGSGYGRCDIRMDSYGELYLLEINPLCSLFYAPHIENGGDFILRNDPRGHKDFIENIIKSALKRKIENSEVFEVRFGSNNFGLYAKSNIRKGQIIQKNEGLPANLISRTFVEKNWSKNMKDDFLRYAYPITDEIYVTWSKNPEEWRPINHSCNPNAWLDGLNLVARRDILKNDEITMDYATFCNEEMEEFECRCGSQTCRKTICGNDYRKPFMEIYDGHVSDYISKKRLHK